MDEVEVEAEEEEDQVVNEKERKGKSSFFVCFFEKRKKTSRQTEKNASRQCALPLPFRGSCPRDHHHKSAVILRQWREVPIRHFSVVAKRGSNHAKKKPSRR